MEGRGYQTVAAAGFDRWGIVSWPLSPEAEKRREDWQARQYEWVSQGNHGEMEFLKRNAAKAFSPTELLPGTKTILVFVLNYHQGPRQREPVDRAYGKIAQYAWGRDYHKVILSRLKTMGKNLLKLYPDGQFKAFTDSNPLNERFFAVEAGLGFIGRHTLLITPGFGSKVFIAMVLTNLAASEFLAPAELPQEHSGKSCPASCRRCIDACPSAAISAQGYVDSRRCISYLTIEKKGAVDATLAEHLDGWLFGCDVCQDVCPYSVRTKPCSEPDFLNHKAGPAIALERIKAIEGHGQMISMFEGSPLMRPGFEKLKTTAHQLASATDQELNGFLEKD